MRNNLIMPRSIDNLIENVLGPTSKEVGVDLKNLYIKTKNNIILILKKAFKKIKNPKDGEIANLRVVRDVFWNGSFTDEDICAEYFGGILASSRSKSGKNDSAIFYLDIIKSLSSGQLKMHYIIYRIFNKILINDEFKKNFFNPGNDIKVRKEKLFFTLYDISEEFKTNDIGSIIFGLYAKNLIADGETHHYKLKNNKIIKYVEFTPSSLGIQLFAIAYNMFNNWLSFAKIDFGDFDGIKLPRIYAQTSNSLLEKIRIQYEKFL